MSETLLTLQHKINTAQDLRSVVRAMKAIAASALVEFESAVEALRDYHKTVELGLAACWMPRGNHYLKEAGRIAMIVIGTDQGLVGPFNEALATFFLTATKNLTASADVYCIGERMDALLTTSDHFPRKTWSVPNAANTVGVIVSELLSKFEAEFDQGETTVVWIYFNRPNQQGGYEQTRVRLLPPDEKIFLKKAPWPRPVKPDIISGIEKAGSAFLHEYIFASLFQAFAESIAAENTSRLAAMQRAEKNIEEFAIEFRGEFQRVRQASIDEELFDVISGYESLLRAR